MKNIITFLACTIILFSCKKDKPETILTIPSSANAIISFSIPGQLSAVISPGAHTVVVTMPFGIKLDSLVAATYTISPSATINIGSTPQVSGATLNNFINTITYTITAENGTAIQDWTIITNYETYTYLYEDFPIANETFYMGIDSTNLQGYSLGTTGKGNIWNFLNLGTETTDTLDFLSPSSHTGGSNFPGSTVVIKDHSTSFDMFANVTSLKAEIMGMYGSVNNILLSVPTTNRLIYLKFPSEFGVSFTDDGALQKDTTITMPPIPIPVAVSLQVDINNESEIDANGIVNTPIGSFKCIREHNVQIRHTQVLVAGSPYLDQYDTTRTYNYFNKEKGYPVIIVEVDSWGNIKKIKHQK
ncbi:MAG: hypothetical protein HY951_00390 [Bacteroidia bacterium]|nr:hypothetical protein [Bacteroidia bacterium]